MESQEAAALAVATERLPFELARLDAKALELLARVCSAPSDEPEALVSPFAKFHLGPFLRPLGDCKPKVTAESSDDETRSLAELYWRCSVALYQMPLAALQALASHHSDLATHLEPKDAEPDVQRIPLVLALLPRFSMVCTTREEAEAAVRRRAEIDKLKAEARALDKAESEGRAAPAQQPSADDAPGEGSDGVLV